MFLSTNIRKYLYWNQFSQWNPINDVKCKKQCVRSYLLGLESELDEDLLQFLIDEIDAKLLEAVALEDLKSVNVQNAYVVARDVSDHGNIDSLQARVQNDCDYNE